MHRFYIPSEDRELRQELWIDDKELVHQWQKVLRFKEGDEVALFDEECEKLYKIDRAEPNAYRLQHVTDLMRKIPAKHVYLFWSLLKKDKNDWVIQKCTELGVSNFVPIISERTENNQFDIERSRKIAIEATEQCGRSDIPTIHEPMSLEQAIGTYIDKLALYYTHMEADDVADSTEDKLGVLVGPEGGWSDAELENFRQAGLKSIQLGNFVYRAETASIVATSKLIN
ncbi:16S rRNA (uracil(1498)-N(3))-methyltransferase [Candidatus Saccharibacteria bacterium]|nr:16S rRNA (uracil(1498)-N(3))-methyltransferase [Candidatus Saccharibacteria bacterium]MCB9821343.1 16S rRNA (uracil(1498)-N(3))-methyltransferase [Candidatus Nomurabacteria bacterium]